jgi:hypothetical protein
VASSIFKTAVTLCLAVWGLQAQALQITAASSGRSGACARWWQVRRQCRQLLDPKAPPPLSLSCTDAQPPPAAAAGSATANV